MRGRNRKRKLPHRCFSSDSDSDLDTDMDLDTDDSQPPLAPGRRQTTQSSSSQSSATTPDTALRVGGTVVLGRADERAVRLAGAMVSVRATVRQPQCLALFVRAFPGRATFYTELTILRTQPLAPMTAAVQRSLQSYIEALALLRLATVREAAECEFCNGVAPFCAVVPTVRPPGTKQHRLARSRRCVLARAINGATPTRDRIEALLVNTDGELRLDRDTDAQGELMIMLAQYAQTVWTVAHCVGLEAVLRIIQVVFQQHGLPHPHASMSDRGLEQCFVQLGASVGAGGGQRLGEEHVRVFAADYADYAMHAILQPLRSHLAATSTAQLEAVPACPSGWLVREAEEVHARYAPESYTADDGTAVQVRRDHAFARLALAAWIAGERPCKRPRPSAPEPHPPRAAVVELELESGDVEMRDATPGLDVDEHRAEDEDEQEEDEAVWLDDGPFDWGGYDGDALAHTHDDAAIDEPIGVIDDPAATTAPTPTAPTVAEVAAVGVEEPTGSSSGMVVMVVVVGAVLLGLVLGVGLSEYCRHLALQRLRRRARDHALRH